MCYVYIYDALLTVKYVFYLLFWSTLRIALPWAFLYIRGLVTSP